MLTSGVFPDAIFLFEFHGVAMGIFGWRTKRLMLCGCLATAVIVAVTLSSCSNASPQQQLDSAVLRGDEAEVERLLNDTKNVSVNWKGPKTGSNALLTAADFNQVAIARLLLQRGADPKIANDENQTPLQSAAYHGFTEMVKLLIDAGADVNAAETSYGHSPLIMAARKGHGDIVKLLLDAGADRNATTKDGRSASTVAQQNGHVELAELLIFYQPARHQLEHPADTENSQ